MNEVDLARFDVARWDAVISIGLVRINPFGDCVISLTVKGGHGVALRLFDPERCLDALHNPEHSNQHAQFFNSMLSYVNEKVIGGEERKLSVRSIFFHRDDDRWRAMVEFDGGGGAENLRVDTTPLVALSTFSVGKDVPSYIEKDEPSICDMTAHRDALLFGLRGGEDALEGMRNCVMRSLGMKMMKGDQDEARETEQGHVVG